MSTRGKAYWQGMNWITQKKRLAIYLRDGCACVWCGAAVENAGTILSLDHLKPHSKGGDNSERNLVTCCKRCNDSRGNRSVKKFAEAAAGYLNHGIKPEAILAHIKATSKQPLNVFLSNAAKLIERRGSVFNVLKGRK
jgi:hypothetical protein